MPFKPNSRSLFTIIYMVLFLAALVIILWISDLALSIWQRLEHQSDWFFWTYLSILGIFVVLSLLLFWRLLPKSHRSKNKTEATPAEKAISPESLQQRLEKVDDTLVDTSRLKKELEQLLFDPDNLLAGEEPLANTGEPLANTGEPLANKGEPSAGREPSADKRPSADKEPSANKQPSADYNQPPSTDTNIFSKTPTSSHRQNSQISIVLFGDISSGKSSLINVLLPDAKVETSVIGGTTRRVNRYQWQTPLGDKMLLVDIPGFDEQNRELDEIAKKAVYQGHMSLFICDGDLTAGQYQRLQEIAILGKPLIVVLNKVDRYSKNDLQLISQEIGLKLNQLAQDQNMYDPSRGEKNPLDLISVQSGGEREVTLVYPDGREKTELRPIKPDLSELYTALQQKISRSNSSELEQLRQKSVLKLLSSEIDKVEAEARELRAAEVVKSSTKKAVVGSLATITPGTDLLVQGYLGINMVKDLCAVYEVPAKDIDIEKLLKMVQANTTNAFPLLLAIAGNGFKAFPGVGTVAGGLIHAVAYGLIFDSMGKAVSMTLAVQGDLSPILVDSIYKERLVEDVESRAVEFVKMVLKSKRDS